MTTGRAECSAREHEPNASAQRMLYHLLQLVEDVGFEEVLAPSLSIDVVLEGLQPSITNCFGLAANATVDLDEERRRDELDVTVARQNVSVY